MLAALLDTLPQADLILSAAAKQYIYGPLGIYGAIMTAFVVILFLKNQKLQAQKDGLLERHISKAENSNRQLYELAERLRTLTESLLRRIR